MNLGKTIDEYNKLKKEIYDYFDYEGDWRVYPIQDNREYFWLIDGDHSILFSESREGITIDEAFDEPEGEYSSTVRKIVREPEFTAVIEDTQCDGNIYFSIWDNKKEIKRDK